MTQAIPASIPELLADGPHPDHADALRLYGQFVGSWDVDVTWRERDGSSRRLQGEWHFGWILGGRAIADVWMVPTRAEQDAGAALVGYGVTVRVRDPSTDAWRVTWSNGITGATLTLVARREGDEIVQLGVDAEGKPVRWIFSDVTPGAFRWRNEVSEDRGATWWLRQEFVVRRRR